MFDAAGVVDRGGTSLNQTVIDLLTQALGVHGSRSLTYDRRFNRIARVGSLVLGDD